MPAARRSAQQIFAGPKATWSALVTGIVEGGDRARSWTAEFEALWEQRLGLRGLSVFAFDGPESYDGQFAHKPAPRVSAGVIAPAD